MDHHQINPDPKPMPMRLNIYNDPKTFFKVDNFSQQIGTHYRWTVTESGGIPIEEWKTNRSMEEGINTKAPIFT